MNHLGIEKGEKIVIIGGGFAGLQLAKTLRKADLKVILVDKQNHHQFQPLFYQVASGRLEPSSISFPFRKVFQKSKNVDFRMADIVSIDPNERKIMTAYDRTITYDHLVIASGCHTNFFGNKEMSENTFSMKTTQDAIEIRNKILFSFEKEIFEIVAEIFTRGSIADQSLFKIYSNYLICFFYHTKNIKYRCCFYRHKMRAQDLQA